MTIILKLALGAALLCANELVAAPAAARAEADLWGLARRQTATHRFSTLFTAHDVKNHLSKEEGIDAAIDWCKRSAVTKVYIESFRDGSWVVENFTDEAASAVLNGRMLTVPARGWQHHWDK